MTPERLAEIRKKVSVGVYYSDTLVRELLDHIAQLEAQRGGAVVEFADHRFSVNCDTAQKGGNQAIYVNNDTTGVGYQIAGTDIDGHFKRKTWDLTPYMRPFIETIGIRPIPADRVLADGMVGVDREEWKAANDFASRYAGGWSEDALKPYWLGWKTFRDNQTTNNETSKT